MGRSEVLKDAVITSKSELMRAFDEALAPIRDHIANLERDAARYRWLRNGNAYVPEEEHVRGGEELDKLCDAGISVGDASLLP
jgi:hypothetical protein